MQCSVGHCSAIFVASCIIEKGAEQVATQRAAGQEYHRRRRSDAAARSTENANFKRRRQESR